jgi:hypothetical protein
MWKKVIVLSLLPHHGINTMSIASSFSVRMPVVDMPEVQVGDELNIQLGHMSMPFPQSKVHLRRWTTGGRGRKKEKVLEFWVYVPYQIIQYLLKKSIDQIHKEIQESITEGYRQKVYEIPSRSFDALMSL